MSARLLITMAAARRSSQCSWVAMADAIMALTCNIAMKTKKRVEFKPEWFDPDSPAAPETDKEVTG